MKNQVTQFSLLIIAFVALTFLMSYTHPAADEPKQYTVVKMQITPNNVDKFEEEVNKKLAEGWHLQRSVTMGGQQDYYQAMAK